MAYFDIIYKVMENWFQISRHFSDNSNKTGNKID